MKTKNNSGLIYIFTGEGKGKTSAALGVAMRAVGQGKRAAMVQWYKEKRWKIGEHNVDVIASPTKPWRSGTWQSHFEIYPMGRGFYQLPTDHATPTQHKQAAQAALKLAKKLIKSSKVNRLEGYKVKNRPESANLLTCQPANLFLLILDESLNALHDRLLALPALLALLESRGPTHIILTGRRAPKKLIATADLVTEMKSLKHPYDIGKKAVLGLDY